MVKMRKDEKAGQLVKTYERGFPVGFKASLEVSRGFSGDDRSV
jgi:transmembrane 9 superfamily protein 2/4